MIFKVDSIETKLTLKQDKIDVEPMNNEIAELLKEVKNYLEDNIKYQDEKYQQIMSKLDKNNI